MPLAAFVPVARFRETWTPGESHAYRFVIRVLNDNAAQGRRATQKFTWQARPK